MLYTKRHLHICLLIFNGIVILLIYNLLCHRLLTKREAYKSLVSVRHFAIRLVLLISSTLFIYLGISNISCQEFLSIKIYH